jgi:hypothetical protein
MLSRRVVVVSLVVFVALLASARVAGAKQPEREALVYLRSFVSPGVSPDGVAYDPKGGHLLVVNGATLEVLSLDGELLASRSFAAQAPYVGCDIVRVTNGPQAGHFLVTGFSDTGNPIEGDIEAELEILELDRNLEPVGVMHVTVPYGGDPGDGVAYNPFRRSLLITDQWANALHEVTVDGVFVRTIPYTFCCAHAGIAYNPSTGTYWGVNHGGASLDELDGAGNLLRTFDLTPFGVQQPVGIGFGQGKMFIADELAPPDTNTGGFIHTFMSPKAAR